MSRASFVLVAILCSASVVDGQEAAPSHRHPDLSYQDLFHQLGDFFLGDAYWNALFENPGDSASWITLRLRGSGANRFALGARSVGRHAWRCVSGSLIADPIDQRQDLAPLSGRFRGTASGDSNQSGATGESYQIV